MLSQWSPVMGASYNGHTEVVKLLLDKGLDPTWKAQVSRATPDV